MLLRKVADKSGEEPRRNARDDKLRDERLKLLGEAAADFSAEAKAALALPDPAKPQDALLEPWPLSHIEILDPKPTETIDKVAVERALAEGWLAISNGQLHFQTKPKRTSYRIVRAPGVYCCHCGASLEGGNEIGQAHVRDCALGAESPDTENPSGYKVTHFYSLEAA